MAESKKSETLSQKQANHGKKDTAHLIVHATPVRLELVSQRAYQIFEERGCVHGFDGEDWIEADKQLIAESLN